MHKNKILFIFFIILSLSLIFTGCKKSTAKIDVPDLGFSMNLPKGWQVDPKENTFYYEKLKPDDNLGWVVEYELEQDEPLSAFIDSLLADEQAMYQEQKEMLQFLGEELNESEFIERKVVSRTSHNISGYEAIVMISEADYSIIEAFIRKDNSVIITTFRTLKQDFPDYESNLKKVIGTISIK